MSRKCINTVNIHGIPMLDDGFPGSAYDCIHPADSKWHDTAAECASAPKQCSHHHFIAEGEDNAGQLLLFITGEDYA